jgi:hypothetical protein
MSASNPEEFKHRKIQITTSQADYQRLLELAEVMTIPISQLGAIAIREWLLNNYSNYKQHYLT